MGRQTSGESKSATRGRGPGQSILSIRIEPALMELIDQDARKHGLSRSAWMRKVVEARLRTAKLLPKG